MEYQLPSKTIDPYTLFNDENGFSVYSLVLFATPIQQSAIQDVREQVRVRRSMLPAHVTVKGPFCEILSISEVQSIIEATVQGTGPVSVEFRPERTPRTLANGEVVGVLAVEVNPELAGLHLRLLEAFDPVSTNAHPPEARGWFNPHLTVYHEPEPELEATAGELLRTLDIGPGFTANVVSLMGHSGTPYRGEWLPISEHRLG